MKFLLITRRRQNPKSTARFVRNSHRRRRGTTEQGGRQCGVLGRNQRRQNCIALHEFGSRRRLLAPRRRRTVPPRRQPAWATDNHPLDKLPRRSEALGAEASRNTLATPEL